jgi:hypothetical protein
LLHASRVCSRNFTQRRKIERDLAEEITSYVDLATLRKVKQSLSESDARREALGGAEQIKERQFAKRFWPNQSIGKRIRHGKDWLSIVAATSNT